MSVEPKRITVGDTVTWDREESNYPADQGWTLTYYLLNSTSKITIVAAANGAAYRVTVSAATTAAWVYGHYVWTAIVTKAAERYTVDSGRMLLSANVATAATLDQRSAAKRTLDVLTSAIEGRITSDVQSYVIEGRSLIMIPIVELIMLRDKYAGIVMREEWAERAKSGQSSKNVILTRFTS